VKRRVFPSRRLRGLAAIIDRRELRIYNERSEVSEGAWLRDLGVQSAPFLGEKIGVGEMKSIFIRCRKPFGVKRIVVPSDCAVSFEIVGMSVGGCIFVDSEHPISCVEFSPVSDVEISSAMPDLDQSTTMVLTVRNIGLMARRFVAVLRGETLRRVRKRKGKPHAWQWKLARKNREKERSSLASQKRKHSSVMAKVLARM
jgi:hypothetical protein